MKKLYFLTACAVILSGCSAPDMRENVCYAPDDAGEIPASCEAAPEPVMAHRANAKSVNSAPADGASGYFQRSNRMMAYESSFTLTVKESDKALDDIKLLAEKLGGYLVSSHDGRMIIKVPVAKADEFLKSSAVFGKVSRFSISTDDLTDTITDLNVRLENLRKLRARLADLLNAAKKVEDILRVERELNRVTTEIERMEATLKNNQNRVNYVTFNISVVEQQGLMPDGTPQAIAHFSFLKKLMSTAAGGESYPLFGLEVPENFVTMPDGGLRNVFAATSSDDCVLRMWKVYVADDSTLEFWQQMIARTLQSKKSLEKIKVVPTGFDGRKAVKITGEVTTRRGIESYMAVISIKSCWGDDQLQIVEFFGPQEAFNAHEAAVNKMLTD